MGRVCVGVIVGAHGIRGGVRVKCFTDAPEDLDAYGPLWDDDGKRQFKARVTGVAKGLALVMLDGVTDRNRAESMKGVRLCVPRDALPEADPEAEGDEFLVADLVGAQAVTPAGEILGTVKGVFDFGAGDLLEIAGPKGGLMVPFTRQVVPEVDVVGRKVVVDPPPFAPDDEADQGRGNGPEDEEEIGRPE